MALVQLEKSLLPDGFKFLGEARGTDAGEFGLSDEQVAQRYLRGAFAHEHLITVCWSTDAELPLTGTEGREPVIVGDRITYFDGEWASGPGESQVDDAFGTIHWSSRYRHSVRISLPQGVLGIRANPLLLDIDSLVSVGMTERKLMGM